MRISSPPFLHRCYYGTDIPDEEMLAAHNRTVSEVAELIGADSLMYLELEDIAAAMKGLRVGYCDACFTGNNPVPGTTDRENLHEGRIKV